ncbi:flavin monoamine oxidase family protein [Amycolatopsis oliviviridis]|uniref:Flavin-containing monoamine oxidase AofH n=1 Tax=Amycolatopsis oliviviridis TaxID=1471590 RepID=A0ABQ3LF50_9PSEU|nr:flavin monoamine oxidase family protein [Amycolatopsis oliviviridis]GHH14323.1 putative flavin-containing monoamine oxidase AofH [Amycolatopsis oliviviridis]
MSHHSSEIDVVVVGAGMAGLVCAHRLRGRGVRVLLLEACPQAGGRTVGAEVGGEAVDLGGQFIGPGQDRVYALAEELGVAVFQTYTAGANLLETETGRLRGFRGMVPKLGPLTLLDVGRAQSRLDRLARSVDTETPWRGPDAFDGQTLRTWIDRTAKTRGGRRFLTLACQAIWACEPSELSLLHALFYIRAAGSLSALTDVEGGAQQDRLDGGAHGLAGKLAERLGPVLRLGEPVRRIEQDDSGVTVTAEDGTAWRAGYAVVAVAPPLAARIGFHPPLPPARDNLVQRLPMGSVLKCVATYTEPFWRQADLSGAALSLRGPIAMTVDSSPRSGGRGVLIGFVTGAAARELGTRSPAVRRRILLDALTRLFGSRAGAPLGFAERNWNEEPFTRGAYSAVFPPGAWTGSGSALRAPCGRIHWAGTETSTRWYGYIEGAVRSGEAAADAVTPLLPR